MADKDDVSIDVDALARLPRSDDGDAPAGLDAMITDCGKTCGLTCGPKTAGVAEPFPA